MFSLRKVFLGAITLILVSGIYAFTAYAEEVIGKQGIVTGDIVNFRREPNTAAEIFTALAGGTQVSVLESSGEWYKINYKGSTGWIHSQHLQVASVEASTGKVAAVVLNVRSEPSSSSKIERKLKKGQMVSILTKSGKWYMVKNPDTSLGWIDGDYVVLDKPNAVKGDIASRGGEASRNISEQNAAKGEEIAKYSKKFLGVPYKWGGATPKGFDCSGLTYYIYKQFGITLDRTASGQATQGVLVDKSELRPGDLIFFDTEGENDGQITHDGLYIGDNKFIHSANSKTAVRITDLADSYYTKTYVKAKRIIN